MNAAKNWLDSQPFYRIELRPCGALGYFGTNTLTPGSAISFFEGDRSEVVNALANTPGYYNAYDDVWEFRTKILAAQSMHSKT